MDKRLTDGRKREAWKLEESGLRWVVLLAFGLLAACSPDHVEPPAEKGKELRDELLAFVRTHSKNGHFDLGTNINPIVEKYFKPGDDLEVAKGLLLQNDFYLLKHRCHFPIYVFVRPGENMRDISKKYPKNAQLSWIFLKPGENIDIEKERKEYIELDRRVCEKETKEALENIYFRYEHGKYSKMIISIHINFNSGKIKSAEGRIWGTK
jgi:hypothetical protein